MRNLLIISIAVLTLSGCASTQFGEDGTRTSATIQTVDGVTPEVATTSNANEIIITENDITDRPYIMLGEISVSASKLTVFNKDPTRKDIDERLRNEAAKLGADAVIFTRYVAPTITFTSWGTMKGNGRAIKFSKE